MKSHIQRERDGILNKFWWWIIIGVTIISGLLLGIYFFPKNTKQEPSNKIYYLPSKERFEEEVAKIQREKGLTEEEASLEFVASFVPWIGIEKLNSLAELEQKIKEIKEKILMSPWSSVPSVAEFGKEINNCLELNAFILLSINLPRKKNDSQSIDWDYVHEIDQGTKPKSRFNPTFATIDNYQKLTNLLVNNVNSKLIPLEQEFSRLDSVKSLNSWQDRYLNEMTILLIYHFVREKLASQLAINNHIPYEMVASGQTTNSRLSLGNTYTLSENIIVEVVD